MPRAFLITRRRYNGTGEFEEIGREYSPERGVRLAEYGGGQQPTSDGASECGSESSSECPEELYNLTKLAEVSLAAAAGTLVHPATNMYQRPAPLPAPQQHSLFFERIEAENQQLHELKSCRRAGERQRFPAPFNQNGVQHMTTMDIVATPAQAQNPMLEAQHQNLGQQPLDGTEEHECPDCGKKYSTSSNLARHRQTHRSLGDKKARRCPHCDKVYVSIPAFSMHVRTHNQGCKCHFCGKCFSRPWLLQGHIRTHTGEKPFKCTICNKAFADKSNLRAHIQTHSNTKPHVCGRCGKAFALKSYLYKHEESSCMRSHHQKRETSVSPTSSTSSSSLSSSPRTISTSPSSSHPTSVIVPPRGNPVTQPQQQQQQQTPNSAFSAIIKHTGVDQDVEAQRSRDLLSRMVIRTSVISPNPEHLAARKIAPPLQPPHHQQQQPANHQVFDFNDPQRLSAFSRPQPMTLNLAIA